MAPTLGRPRCQTFELCARGQSHCLPGHRERSKWDPQAARVLSWGLRAVPGANHVRDEMRTGPFHGGDSTPAASLSGFSSRFPSAGSPLGLVCASLPESHGLQVGWESVSFPHGGGVCSARTRLPETLRLHSSWASQRRCPKEDIPADKKY